MIYLDSHTDIDIYTQVEIVTEYVYVHISARLLEHPVPVFVHVYIMS